MALFKPFRGTRASLDAQELHDGYAYFCTDDGSFHIDYVDSDGNLQRKQINAKDAETLCGMSLDEIKNYVAVQSDWNQNDSTAPDYIKNRTHYTEETVKDVEYEININGEHDIPLTLGQTYELWYTTTHNSEWVALTNSSTDEIITCEVQEDADGLYVGDPNHSIWPTCVRTTNSTVMSQFISAYSIVSMKIVTHMTTTVVHKIDQKFVPNADWNVNDENANGYIKNRPFGDIFVEKEYIFERGDVTTASGTHAYKLSCADFDGNKLVVGEGYSVYYTTSFTDNSIVWAKLAPTDGEKFIAKVDENGVVYVGDPAVNSDIFYISSQTCAVNYMWVNQFTYAKGIKLVGPFVETKQIDPKYLPEDFIVIITQDDEGNYTADKTFEEIFAAYNEGRTVQAKYIFDNTEGTLYYLTYIFTDDQAVFTNNAFAYQENLIIYPDNTIEYVELDLVVSDWFDEEMDNIRSSIVQSNWSQYDSTALDYIQNRPMYFDVEPIAENLTASGTASAYTTITPEFIPVDGASYYIKGVHTNDKAVTTAFDGVYECKNGKIDILPWDGSGCPILNITADGINVGISNSYRVASVIIDVIGVLIYHTLDERYIPNTIARTSDIPKQVQPDWSQNNETAVDYIKNRTHYEAVEELVVIPSTEVRNRGIISVADPSVLEAGKQCVITVNSIRYETTIRSDANLTRDGEVLTHPIGLGSWMAMNMSTSSISIVESIDNCPFGLVLMGSSLMFAYESDDVYNGVYTVEVSILGSVVHQLDEKYIPDTIARVEYVDVIIEALKPKSTTITIPAANWTGDANPWSQVVTINGVTENSKVDLQPTAQQVVALQNADIALMTENNNGVVTVYSLGGKPTTDYTMQVLITEVTLV